MNSAAICRQPRASSIDVLQMLEESPQSLLFGPPQQAPGPGEAGFVAPSGSKESR
jgi:hypothetical protein